MPQNVTALDNLVDAEAMAKTNPDSFFRPSENELIDVIAGDFIKVRRNGESFWIKVAWLEKNGFAGTINNNIVRPENSDIRFGQLVTVERAAIHEVVRFRL